MTQLHCLVGFFFFLLNNIQLLKTYLLKYDSLLKYSSSQSNFDLYCVSLKA